MGLRQKVDRERIKNFFKKLGQRFRREGRVCLVGGTTLVFEQLREQTVDRESLKQDPIEFEENFRALETLWRIEGQS